jgi:hypothetical protein
MVEILAILLVPMVFLIIFGFLAFEKRLKHKQIMKAIEKGTPLSDFIPPKPKPSGPAWIKYVSSGIMLLIIGLGFTFFHPGRNPGHLVFAVLCGVGVGLVVRGLLHRKYYLKNQSSPEINSTETKTPA